MARNEGELLSIKHELLEEQAIVRKQISDLKAHIKEVKAIRFHTGQYESVYVYNDMQKKLAENALRNDQISAELSALKTQRQTQLRFYFMQVCREEIDEEDFKWIMTEAKRRMTESALPESATDL